MDSLATLGALSGLPREYGQGLEDLGWNVQRLGTLHDEEEAIIGEVLTSLEGKVGRPLEVEPLLGLIEVAQRAAEVAWRVEGGTSGAELLVASEMRKLEDRMNEWRTQSMKRLTEIVPLKGTAKIARWPTRLQKKMNAAGDDQALRERAEKDERLRWIKELRKQLEDGRCPAVAGDGGGSAELSRRFGKGRRASTLRKHVKTWEKLSSWVKATFRHPWPENAGEVAMYLESRADEPCGRTVPSSIFKTLMFMENAGEIPPDEQLCKDPAVKNVLEEVNMQLAEKGGGFTRRAWHILVSIVGAWEEVVMDEEKKEYVRCYAWFRLVKVWTGMRFSDTCGMLESSMEMHSFGLTAILAKTKTTGPGKKVQHLRIWVNKDCWLREKRWLVCGYQLWKDLGKDAGLLERDFGLPCPAKDLRGFAKRMATYTVASKCSQALFNELVCIYDDAEVPLLAVSAGLLWTEHSERASLRSWSEAAGVPEDVRKQLGRWVPVASQVYERTGRANVLRAQSGIAETDPFDESLVFSSLADKMVTMGFPEGAIELQIEKLMTFNVEPGSKRAKIKGLDVQGFASSDEEGWLHVPFVRPSVFNAMPALDDEDQAEDDGEILGPSAGGAEKVPHGTYVLSVTGRCNRKTLHRVGECHRVPGIHYGKFEVVGENPPAASEFHQSCRICFPRGIGTEGRESSDEGEDSDDVSSSDSTTSVEESSSE
eukprot:s391_g9.t1